MITRTRFSILTCSTLLATVVACTPDSVLTPLDSSARNARTGTTDGTVRIRSGKFIIIGNNESLPADFESRLTRANGRVERLMSEVGLASVASDDPDFAAKAARIPGVRSVIRDIEAQFTNPIGVQELDESVTPSSPTNPATNTFFPRLWGMRAISAPAAWAAGYQGEGAKVAILDGGFDLNHPDLISNVVYDRSFVPGEASQYALPGVGSHGTHVAGTVAALDNNFGVIGVAPKAKLYLIKVLRDTGSGAFSWIMQGIMDAAAQKVDVANMSLGAYLPRNGKFLNDNGTPNDPSDDFIENDAKAVQEIIVSLTRVCNYARKEGVTLIAAAGNSGIDGNHDRSGMTIPGNIQSVIGISATAPTNWFNNPNANFDRLASYSNFGTPDVSFAAPGGDLIAGGEVNDLILSTGNSTGTSNRYYFSAGTSMASPHATGVAALIVAKNGGPMDPSAVEAALRASADDLGKSGRDPIYGFGRVNAARAVGVNQ